VPTLQLVHASGRSALVPQPAAPVAYELEPRLALPGVQAGPDAGALRRPGEPAVSEETGVSRDGRVEFFVEFQVDEVRPRGRTGAMP
jgi:hypothetical protein